MGEPPGLSEDVAALLEPVDLPPAEPNTDIDDELVELPFVYLPPPSADVAAAAATAPLLRQIDTMRDYLGESGKALTDGEGRALVELLDTGDDVTSERLPGLHSIVFIAKRAGAVHVDEHCLIPVEGWSALSVTERATAVYRAIVEIGPLGSRGQTYELFDTVDEIVDGGTVHWLAALLAPDSDSHIDEIVDQVEPVLREEIEPYWPQWSDTIEQLAQSGVTQLFRTLEAAGVVEWAEDSDTIRLSALGRHLVPEDLPEAGYLLRRVDDLADAPATALLEALDWVPGGQRSALVDAWQPDVDAADRARQIVEVILSSEALRVSGFGALSLLDPVTAGRALRGLLDGPAATQAALHLLALGLADEAQVGRHVGTAALVDVLAATLDDPEQMCALFVAAPPRIDHFATLEQMWRQPGDETGDVLDALGEHLPDRALAKAARKAAIKHRSWMANRG
ncbi:MAG: hypothetical protein JO152_14100 [Mycobacteriaceae bacterium]|nr:hypothetical protein [Mycobacteriaceae bacterium]